MIDYAEGLIDAERFSKQAAGYLQAAQSVGPTMRYACMRGAEMALLEAIASLRDTLACVRGKGGGNG